MKITLITLIAAFALTHAATAGTSTWFRGGIGLPNWSFTSPAEKETTAKQTTAKTPAKSISKQTDRRVTSR